MSWFGKLKDALSKTSSKISSGIDDILHKKKLEFADIEELEDLLITSDLGVHTASEVVENIRKMKFHDDLSKEEIKAEIAGFIAASIAQYQKSFELKPGLNVVLVCGVNGNGKTTTIGKLANFYMEQGKKVSVAACDTFRAAATEQLVEWGKRAGCNVVTGAENSDPASVAYKAISDAISRSDDLLFIDTAGRLHNNKGLMDELSKMIKVIKKLDENAPHETLLVLDATTGQNAFNQAKHFSEVAGVTGLVVTKLDGTAKGGIVIGLCKKFNLPVYFIGIGEKLGDLKPFNLAEFSRALLG
ncbi:MAG: signal recognition particle-docking protein FtsY [Rickettsiaceae bacterium]|nr:signal recognition particle-docking protein FtsY [Rickettsiaceae bacterium]